MSQKTENTGFTCAYCSNEVTPLTNGSYRNHCPSCLCSLHVDDKPGDRQNDCHGLMMPISIHNHSKKGWQILHKCQKCGAEKLNRSAPDDIESLLKVARNSAMKNALKYITIFIITFAVLFSAFFVPPRVSQAVSSMRSRMYWDARRWEDTQRNMYLMAKQPENFAGSYYCSRYRSDPGRLVIYVVENGHDGVNWPARARLRNAEFTYAQLRDTKEAVTAAMEARPGCVYVSNITSVGISISCNRVLMNIINLSSLFEDIEAGFRQHIYNSEMIEFRHSFEFHINGQGSYKYFALILLPISAIIAFYVFFAVEGQKSGVSRWRRHCAGLNAVFNNTY